MDVQLSLTERARVVLCTALLVVPLSSQQHPAPPKIPEGRYTISGRVVDRDAIIPKDAMLVLVMPTMLGDWRVVVFSGAGGERRFVHDETRRQRHVRPPDRPAR